MQVDPYGAYGVSQSAHMHSFGAFEDPNEDQTPDDLRSALANECESPDLDGGGSGTGLIPDKSSYWAPALYSTNPTTVDWADPSDILVYYSSDGVDPNTILAFDQDFTFRAGNPHATLNNPQDQARVQWSCIAVTPPEVENEVNHGVTIPHTCPKNLTYVNGEGETITRDYYLRLVVNFPNCIDFDEAVTQNGQWNPRDEEGVGWAYAVDTPPESAYPMHCADPAMTPIPRLKIGYRWPLSTSIGITTYLPTPNTWDLTSLKVASDMSNMQNDGVSAHADFMSGWSTNQLQELMENCFWDTPRNCGFIGEDDEYYDE